MIKYQCNACGMIYSLEMDAVKCHPDINVIDDDDLPKRDAAEHYVERTEAGPTIKVTILTGRDKSAACLHKNHTCLGKDVFWCYDCGKSYAALPD